MFRFLQRLFRGRPVRVPDTGALPEGEARAVNLGDVGAGATRVVLCRVGGKLYALDSLCPHKGARIRSGPLEGGTLAVCPLHHFAFDPRNGKVVRGTCGKAQTYTVVERDGEATLFV